MYTNTVNMGVRKVGRRRWNVNNTKGNDRLQPLNLPPLFVPNVYVYGPWYGTDQTE